jgi:multidrug efflux pump
MNVTAGPSTSAPRASLANFFIARPIFAIVLAIATMLAGVMGIYSLPISQYPEIAPTTVRVSASYPGATAEAVENSVTAEIESAMTGLDGLLYMESSSSTGSASITLTFGNSIDADIVQVDVQNKLSPVLRRLPESVQREGVRVSRSSSEILMIGNIISTDRRYTTFELSDIMANQIEDIIERVEGVGGLQAFGTGYAMRIWLDPMALQQFQLTPNDVTAAIKVQNVQVTAGAIGASPTVPGQQLKANITAQSQLKTADEFGAIILKFAQDGSTVRLRDVARVELGLNS